MRINSQDGPGGVAAIDQLVHAHVKDVYEFVRAVYPLADATATVTAVFAEAQRAGPRDAEARTWLFARARTVVNAGHDQPWRAANAARVRRSVHTVGTAIDDWHAWTEVGRLEDALAALDPADQEIVRLTTAVDGLALDHLAEILDLEPAIASRRLTEALARFRAAYTAAGDADGEVGA